MALSFALSIFFDDKRVNRIKNKFTALTKGQKVTLVFWIKCAVNRLIEKGIWQTI